MPDQILRPDSLDHVRTQGGVCFTESFWQQMTPEQQARLSAESHATAQVWVQTSTGFVSLSAYLRARAH